MKQIILLWTIFCFTSVSVVGQTNIGEQCLARRSLPGTCKAISNCASVRNDLINGYQDYVVCFRRGMTEIVCCPGGGVTATRRTTTTRRPTTTRWPMTARRPTTTRRPTTSFPTRISARKCNEYRRLAQRRDVIITSTVFERAMSNCSSIPLIAGGTVANVGEFPHMALVGYQIPGSVQWLCGGSLISERFVLTAAHCTKYKDSGDEYNATYVRLGEHDRNHDDHGKEMDIPIEEIIRHPNYKASRHYYDIALLKLDRTIALSIAIRPACLYQGSGNPRRRIIATGWGALGPTENLSDVLMKVELEPFSHASCNSTLQPYMDRKLKNGILDETQMCAGSRKRQRDTCQGDSGGPLQIYHETHECAYDVVGVTSFGLRCGIPGVPAVYTRVYAFLDWIESTVWPDQ